MKDFVKKVSLAAILLTWVSSAATSQATAEVTVNRGGVPEQADVTANQPVVSEPFDGDDPSLILGGQIDFRGDSSPWLVYLADGKLVMENRQKPSSIHYNDITWVKFPDSGVLESTENAVISATVGGENVGSGGAGIIVGSGKAGSYLMFSVDAQSRYHIFKKEGRKVRPVHSAKHPAIVAGAPNKLSFAVRGAHAVFFANGTEIIQIPLPRKLTSLRQNSGQAGVGIAAFGIGTFNFDSVEISRAN